MPNSYSRRNRSNNSTLALLSKPPLAPARQVEGRLVTPGGVGQHSPAHGGHHSIAKPPALGFSGSKVLSATVAARDRLPLSRPRQMGGPASITSPTTTSSAPNPKTSMLVSPDRSRRWRLGRAVGRETSSWRIARPDRGRAGLGGRAGRH